ncbi:DNA repair protein RecO [Alkalilimnicola ehrlichii MLHE-1]|uniref:DNA repair protein RecO n=1 Tax=Alkalilimnicola ehrlichii (strain ATCC BAA-1101 / DSM 17681 / MLHE-1) TaxID=187272 RepID=RECO_ALKEH|nr:DNA repair protein RecO [Alkalilimnicola ehrlichii]Q0A8Y9.1 RecName: Full=DNA repair protein RecO; AltName: Full=Recombination protein O [Alkalilimnicola ehrlichii MLHE-1]ABI56698.1 DNA replication and repair protein RecO [Alkalilimnicola ehrlichii MLHE-1]
MSGDRVLVQPAWVLHRRPWSESSLIVELFSRDFGRIGAVARGGRNSRRWRGLLEPFSPVLASWQGRGELRSLVAAEPDGARPALAGAALASGFYLNELLLRLLRRDDPHPELHPLYGDTLNRLPDEAALRGFECRLLEALGYGLLLLEDMGGEPVHGEAHYRYHLEHGPERLAAVPEAGEGLLVRGRTLLALAGREALAGPSLPEARRLMRAALSLYLGDRPLQSRALYRQLARTPRAATPASPNDH